MAQRAEHWDGIYSDGGSDSRSWHEREPSHSLALIEDNVANRSATIIDVGAGTSRLVDRLLERGFSAVTVLDISAHALDQVRDRLGALAKNATFVAADVLEWRPDRHYDLWHDRVFFHFLTDPAERSMYVSLIASAVRVGGVVVVATFADDGPSHCSGLRVAHYSPEALADAFGAEFEPLHQERELHNTPTGAIQPFTWMVLRKT